MQKNIGVLPLYFDYVLNAKNPVIILVGGRNSGKTFFIEQLLSMKTHGIKNYKCVVVEDVEVNIGSGVKNGLENRIEEMGLLPYYKVTKQPPKIAHKNKASSVIFKGYKTAQQQKQFKSLNQVTAVWYEEAENITYEQFKALRMQLRGGQNNERQFFLTLNPVNENSYINKEFFQKPPDKVFLYFDDGRPKVFERHIRVEVLGQQEVLNCLVVVSTHWDNPFLTNEQRADIEELKYTDRDMHEMLAMGKFIKPAATFFKEFEHGVHTCRPFEMPVHWRRYRALDYGLDMLACYWIAISDSGKAFVYKELYESDLIISEAAKRINEMTGEKIAQTFAPPDLWNRRQETGKSAAEIFYENGVIFTRSNNNRQQGWLDLKEWLKPFKDEQGIKTADLVIFDTCENLIRALPQLQRDKACPNDVDSKTNHELTHAPDALRSFVAGRPAPNKPIKKISQGDFFTHDKNLYRDNKGDVKIL